MQSQLKSLNSFRRATYSLCPVIAFSLALTAAQAQWVSTASRALQLNNATLIGAVPASTPMHIAVGLKMQNASLVQPTLKRMLTPGDPLYGTSLNVSQFVAQFAPTTAQVQAVENYLSSYGFKNLQVEQNHLLVQADGTAGEVEAAFNTSLARFSQNGKTVFANTLDVQVPVSLSTTVLAVLGLNNLVGLQSSLIKYGSGCPLDSCPVPEPSNEVYGAQQYQIAYDAADPNESNPNATNLTQKVSTGSKTSIAILTEGDLGTVSPTSSNSGKPSSKSTGVIHDLYLYEQLYKLPAPNVYLVNVGIPSPDTSGADEWDLDTQTSTGIAQQVANLYLYIATSLTDSDIGLAINKFAEDNKAKALNISLGECEVFPYLDGAMLLDDEMFAEAALQGQTAFAAADDNGSSCPVVGVLNGVPLSGPPGVSYPASSPYVIAVGGTNLLTNADFTYAEETAWEGGGGGISGFETSPFWQSYTGSGSLPIVPSSEAGDRGVPDVAMCAGGTGLAICSANIYVGGSTELVGGTSLSSPLSVGSWARIESSHSNKLGFAGPLIYQLANGGPTPSSPYFNDVQLGSNGAYTAAPGWDYTTGLGSWDIYDVNKNMPTTYPH